MALKGIEKTSKWTPGIPPNWPPGSLLGGPGGGGEMYTVFPPKKLTPEPSERAPRAQKMLSEGVLEPEKKVVQEGL